MNGTPLLKTLGSEATSHADTDCTGTAGASFEFITEAEAYERFGHLLEDKELRVARQEGRLGYLRRKRKIFYRLSELQNFIDGALEQEYVRAPRSLQSKPTSKLLPTPVAEKGLRVAGQSPATTSSSSIDAGLSRLAQKIARSEGRI